MRNSFKSNPSLLLTNPNILQEYYLFLKTKLTCDNSLKLVEEEIFSVFYKEYISRQTSDFLLNTKIDLYKERIKPIHLNITNDTNNDTKNVDTNNVIYNENIKNMEYKKSPTEILEIYLLFIENNSQGDHDTLLNKLVYSILKSGIRNLKVLVGFIKKYRRKVFIHCEHTKRRNESEVEYYLNVLEIALEFIERMEYKDLNITKEDYESLIGINN